MSDQPAGYMPPLLEDVVESISFMPGWSAYLTEEYDDDDGSGGLQLCIVSLTPNSFHQTEPIRVRHSFLVPAASYNQRTWKAWIRDCYSKVWDHEIGEFLMFDGVREFGPHHGNGENPYVVWHAGDVADTKVRAGDSKP